MQWAYSYVQAATGAQRDPSSYDHNIFLWPFMPLCVWDGEGGVAGAYNSYSGYNGFVPLSSSRTPLHELGHNLGLDHASKRHWAQQQAVTTCMA